eukprot:scaffold23264_cov24-Attheya_sp.AAC.1
MAQNSTGHGRAAIPLVLNKKQNKKKSSWDERFKELVDFKKINGHANVPTNTGPFGTWISNQRMHYRLLQEGKDSSLTIDRYEKLESIGFVFTYRATFFISWNQRFQELVDFKKINGHTNVHTGSGPLGSWVGYQRRQCRLLQEGKASAFSVDKREKLESIGFEFKLKRRASSCITWDQRFQKLVDFKKINGHTNVPKQFVPLRIWVNNERRQCRLFKEGKDSLMTLERREKLESIGFEFKCQPTTSSWDRRFQELADYKKTNGHTNVPTQSGPLGRWVSYQRTHYRLLQEGKHSQLTKDKRKKLERTGFEFNYGATKFSSWDQRFQELVDYKKINGHTTVPTRSGQLGTWIRNQRAQYSLFQEGKDSLLTIDKCEKLESIGFEFKCRATYSAWNQRFQELVDYKKIEGHTN